VHPKILISAGEVSGDLYAAGVVRHLRACLPEAEFFGCAGVRMREAGVRPVVRAESLSVVGLLEVVHHIPRIYKEYRTLLRAAKDAKPDVAVLADSPDFHLRLAAQLKRLGIPVVYLVAPQVWAWRKGRIRAIRRNTDRLLCIFPFEEAFFREQGVNAEYIGHPLSRLVRPRLSREDFGRKHSLQAERSWVALLPGSRQGEAMRHLPAVLNAAERIHRRVACEFLLGSPVGFWGGNKDVLSRLAPGLTLHVLEGETWDVLAHSELALAASGTVTIEAAFLGTPMVTYYRVNPLSWHTGRHLVNVQHYSMVNLVAGRKIVPELMQNEMSGERLADEALKLLHESDQREDMRTGLAEVAARLGVGTDPLERAASVVRQLLNESDGVTHVA
jgi:lipid-A-disaccharide synthase